MNMHKTVGMGMLVVLASLIIATSPSAQATDIILFGGDPGEGYSPLSTVYAYNLGIYAQTAASVQGITFAPAILAGAGTFPDFTISGNSEYSLGSPDIGSSPNDDALEYINHQFAFKLAGPTPLTLTLLNLTAGKTYQVDLFVNNDDGGLYNQVFDFNGGQVNPVPAGASVFHDVRENVVANGSGQIVVNLTGDDYGRLNAFSVTVVPEPSTVMLMGVSGLLMLRRLQKRA